MNFISYLLKANPGSEFHYYTPVGVFIALLICAALCMRHVYKSKRKTDIAFRRIFKNSVKILVLFTALFTFLMLARYENIPYFSMRLWLLLGGLGFIFLLFRSIRKYRKEYPELKARLGKRETSETEKKQAKRYLPNKKKK
jgi:CDP-diglyceride synthetase